MMKAIIVEDQPPAQRILKKFIEDTATISLAGCFSDVIKANDFIQNNKVDLLFLDINLPKMSGIEFLKRTPNHPMVILTTAYSEYGVESYNYNVVDYLLKPFSFERFTDAVSKAHANTSIKNNIIYVKSGYDFIRINTNDIFHIKSGGDYTKITTQQKTYLSNKPLKIHIVVPI